MGKFRYPSEPSLEDRSRCRQAMSTSPSRAPMDNHLKPFPAISFVGKLQAWSNFHAALVTPQGRQTRTGGEGMEEGGWKRMLSRPPTPRVLVGLYAICFCVSLQIVGFFARHAEFLRRLMVSQLCLAATMLRHSINCALVIAYPPHGKRPSLPASAVPWEPS